MGLKFGLYSTPWMGTYSGHIGSSCNNENGVYVWVTAGTHDTNFRYIRRAEEHWLHGEFSFTANDAKQWAAWGVDYLKYDWKPIDIPGVKAMNKALKDTGRDFVYSLSN